MKNGMVHVSRLLCLTFLLMSTGCAMSHGVISSRNPVYLDDAQGQLDRHFKEEDRYFYVLFGLIPVYQPKLEDKLAPYMRKGVRVANLKIEAATTPTDVGISVLGLLGVLMSSRTVRYEGDLLTTGRGGSGRE